MGLMFPCVTLLTVKIIRFLAPLPRGSFAYFHLKSRNTEELWGA
jgi:hypothetical protein